LEEEKFLPIETEDCESCERIGWETATLGDGTKFAWVCVGQIIKPENPSDSHEERNEIRLCLVKSKENLDDIFAFTWTPYEVTRIMLALTWGLSGYLIDNQPKGDDDGGTKGEAQGAG